MGTSETVDAVDGNVLEGSTTETAVEANSVYTLGMDNSTYQVGMCLYSGTSVRAYSAYITSSIMAESSMELGGNTSQNLSRRGSSHWDDDDDDDDE